MNIGIDLGTYNSAAAVSLGRGKTIMVGSKYGESRYGKNYPSFVLFDYNGQKQIVGGYAEASISRNPELVVWGVKRLIGLSYEIAKQRGEIDRFQYHIKEGPGGSILIEVGGESYTPSHILEFILREIKEDAENPKINPNLDGKIEKAVISVPAYFDGTRVKPIKDAARSAGLGEIETIAEPTAAALVYGLKLETDARILTFDIGAGTLDVTIMLLLNEGGDLIAGELCTSGHEALGGIDMDDLLMSYIIDKYNLSDIKENPLSKGILKEEVEKAKIRLSSRESVPLDLPTHQSVDLTRNELEDVLKPLLEKCRGPLRIALEQANLEARQLDHVLFVGGPTFMPCVRKLVKSELEKLGAKSELLKEIDNWEQKGINPMECVAMGASLKSAGFIKPDVQNDPNGYGTIYGPVPGLPDYFKTIIPSNSSYPLPPQQISLVNSNSEALSVTIPLVKKLPYYENERIVYKYYFLGNYDCYIKPTGKPPEIDVAMELNSDKDLITTLTHRDTRESVRFEKLDHLSGKEIFLQEIREPQPIDTGSGEEDRGGGGDGGGKGDGGGGGVGGGGGGFIPRPRGWTQDQLTRTLHVARMLVDDIAESSQDIKVQNKKAELLELIQNANEPNDARFMLRRIQELLNALINAHVINQTDFYNHMEMLKEIERRK